MNLFGLFFVAAGLFSAAGGFFDWEWFMNNHKARFMSAILTRTGARGFYVILGLGLAVVGVLACMGVIDMES
jgi:hypothetical protein